ncbi:hypothetical protein J5N97_010384 [Dioscorea zingiberensis]|uniref:Uncharacterized protein n=1 Tax=Dioscorea zingiberensis TaxID=325984 RepID=A0A9D5HMF0_9LILI|nr:hypothetical protein J5N97_010384 [Dioscorea zingiberensis]
MGFGARSFANVVRPQQQRVEDSVTVAGPLLERLMASIKDTITLDQEVCDQGKDENQGNEPENGLADPDLKGKGAANHEAGASHRSMTTLSPNEPQTSRADKEKGKEKILGSWTVVQRFMNKGKMVAQPRRSSGQDQRWKMTPSRFEGLQELTNEGTDGMVKPEGHILPTGRNGRVERAVRSGHVATRGTLSGTGRGGRGASSRGGMAGHGSRRLTFGSREPNQAELVGKRNDTGRPTGAGKINTASRARRTPVISILSDSLSIN